ncbi:MAG: ribonuclease D [Sandaracinaceae bacterium]|nr:ribonuclease D [Sandaracinaceae bacterium]
MIRSATALAALAEALAEAEVLGLDAEGDGFFRYRTRLCTLQLADGERAHVIDTLAIEDLSPLAPLLGPEGPLKVVHDVSFDRKMLASRGLPLAPVFDTAAAARMLGEPSTGLAALLEARFEVVLDKRHQRADWGARPLTDDQLAYLAADVVHLPALARELREAALALDVLEEIDEETRYAMERALEPEPVREPGSRIKGAMDLTPPARALLFALAEAREEVAREQDVPPFRVAPNAALLEAAKRRPRRAEDLRRIRGLHRMPSDALRAALAEAERRAAAPPEPPPPAPDPAVRRVLRARESALTSWRAAEAAARGVDVQVVLPGHCLRDLSALAVVDAASVAAVPGLGDKRVARYGERLLALLCDGSSRG